MYIGAVAKLTNLSIKAIRLYEEKGLLAPPKRRGAYRTYSEQDIELLKLIYEAKQLGITLAELKGVIRYQEGAVNWAQIHAFLLKVQTRLEHQREDISTKIASLKRCIDAIDSCPK